MRDFGVVSRRVEGERSGVTDGLTSGRREGGGGTVKGLEYEVGTVCEVVVVLTSGRGNVVGEE